MTINSDDFLYPPEDIQDLQAPDAAQRLQQTFDLIFAQLRRLTSQVGGSTAHDILSATHADATVASAVDGDILIRSGGTWRRLEIGTDGHFLQVGAGLPTWGVDGSLLEGLEHDVLSARHEDSDPASPILGDLITALDVGSVEHSKYWIDGESVDIIPTSNGEGDQRYWRDGAASDALAASGTVKWQRKAIGAAGTVPVSDGSRWDWSTIGSAAGASVGASAYRSSDLLLAVLTETAISLDAEHFDDGDFWDSGDPTRLTVPADQGGLYVANASAALDVALGTGHVQLFLKKNGTEVARNSAAATNTATLEGRGGVTWIGKLNAGDYIELFAVLESGVAHLLKGGSTKTYLQLAKV